MIKKILAFIYNKEKKKWLIVKTKEDAPKTHGKSNWFTVTGNVEQGETNEEAVKREVKEETGLQVEETYDLKCGSIYTWQGEVCEEVNYLAFVKEGKIILNEEHEAYEWFSVGDFSKKIDWTLNKKELEGILEEGVKKKIEHTWTRMDDCIVKNKIRTKFINNGQVNTLDWRKTNTFDELKGKEVNQVYGICFNPEGEMLIIKTKKNWSLPGGTPEQGETFEQTLHREVDEEGDIDIENLTPIGYNKIGQTKNGKKEVFYQLRYIASITKLKKQTIDPATGIIPKRKFIKPEEFLYYCPWGKPGEAMMKEALLRRKSIN